MMLCPISRLQADVLGAQLGRLHKSIESLVSIRRGLSISTTKFAETFAALADAEELKHLTQAMHQLADVEAKVAKFHMKQSSRVRSQLRHYSFGSFLT